MRQDRELKLFYVEQSRIPVRILAQLLAMCRILTFGVFRGMLHVEQFWRGRFGKLCQVFLLERVCFVVDAVEGN